MAELTVQSTTQPDGTIVVDLTGPADIAGVGVLDRQLLGLSAKHPKHVVFNLAGLTFISSICMGSLMQFRRGCVAWGGRVTFAAVNDPVITALRHARLDALIAIMPTVEAALATA